MSIVNFTKKFDPSFYDTVKSEKENFKNLQEKVKKFSVGELGNIWDQLKKSMESIRGWEAREEILHQSYLAYEGLDLPSTSGKKAIDPLKHHEKALQMMYIYKAERFIFGYLKHIRSTAGECKMPEATQELIDLTAKSGFSEVNLKSLGKGGYGEVEEVMIGDRAIARKRILVNPKDQVSNFELRNLLSLKHPNILQLVGVVPGEKLDELFLEKAEKSLQDLEKDPNLTAEELCAYLKDIVEALVYLQKNQLIHYDVKTANILIVEGKAKLADFDMMKKAGLTYKKGSTIYRAPETFQETYHPGPMRMHTTSVDIWSLGVVIYKILSGGQHHLSIRTQKQLLDIYNKQTFRIKNVLEKLQNDDPERLEKLDPTGQLRVLMSKCLTFDGRYRPLASEIRDHAYFQEVRLNNN